MLVQVLLPVLVTVISSTSAALPLARTTELEVQYWLDYWYYSALPVLVLLVPLPVTVLAYSCM